MKKILLSMMIVVILSGAAACRKNSSAVIRDADGRLNVTTTIFAPYDFVRQIAGDRVNLSMLLPPGSESHSFEPSPRDIITIQNSGLFIRVGGESENWIERILKSMNTDNMEILALMEIVELVEEEIIEGMEDHDDHEHDGFFARLFSFFKHDDHDEEGYDEHVWTSPKNAILIVREITEQLCKADPDNAVFFRQNAAAYIDYLRELDAAF